MKQQQNYKLFRDQQIFFTHFFTFRIMTHTTNTLKTYKVMYYFGAWISKETFAAESDAEAIFDADMIVANAPARGKLTYALWQGNRRIKTY